MRDAEEILNAGAEKVSINSPALANPPLIDQLSTRFGAQCVVIGIDSQLTAQGYRAYQFSGDPTRTQQSGRDVLEWVREVQERGAGEIVLNCMGSDGVRRGYDIEQLREVRQICRVPLVASGGFWVPREVLSRFVDSILSTTQGRRLRSDSPTELSRREQEVLSGLLENLANKEIGNRLNIS